MIYYVKMDIFESPANCIVNTVNTVGVMGKGIAKQFKVLYPEMFDQYRHFCEIGLIEIGKLWIYKSEKKCILNFPTKKHWRNPSKIEYIEAGLKKFRETYQEKGITSISFPPLGCGNGGLDWLDVKPIMEKYLKDLQDIIIYIHEPMEKSEINNMEHKNISQTKKWLQSNPRDLSWPEVFDDLIDLSTITGKYSYNSTNKQFINNITKEVLDEECIFEYWQILRRNGIITTKFLPKHLRKLEKELTNLYVMLNYIEEKEVKIINENNQTQRIKAIKIKPNFNEQVELFI